MTGDEGGTWKQDAVTCLKAYVQKNSQYCKRETSTRTVSLPS